MANGSERRRETRFVPNDRIEVIIHRTAKSISRSGLIVDISEHGLSFAVGVSMEPGDQLTVEYEGCRVVGEVRYCRPREYASQRRYLVGVAVRGVEQGAEIWRRLIQQCCGEETSS